MVPSYRQYRYLNLGCHEFNFKLINAMIYLLDDLTIE
jgi:hypothetical protein